eukprot:3148083-Rhodomonas_salina.1
MSSRRYVLFVWVSREAADMPGDKRMERAGKVWGGRIQIALLTRRGVFKSVLWIQNRGRGGWGTCMPRVTGAHPQTSRPEGGTQGHILK